MLELVKLKEVQLIDVRTSAEFTDGHLKNAKNIKPITNGEINFPNKIPNLNQILFNGDNKLEFITPKIKKIVAIARDLNLILSPLKDG